MVLPGARGRQHDSQSDESWCCTVVGSIVGLQMVNAKGRIMGLDIRNGLRSDTRARETGRASQVIGP